MKRFLVLVAVMFAVIGLGVMLSFKFQNQDAPSIQIQESENEETEELISYYQSKLDILQRMETLFTSWSLDDPERWGRVAELAKKSRQEMELAIRTAQENKLTESRFHCQIADDGVREMIKIRNSQLNETKK